MLIVGFGLHNATEGFGIVAPALRRRRTASWRFLAMLGLIGGGPTFIGTLIGQSWVNETVSVAFLALAAGSILYVVMQLMHVNRQARPQGARGLDAARGSLPRLRDRLHHRSRRRLAAEPGGSLRRVSRYASVYPLVTTRALSRPFTYEAPDEVQLGSVVSVRLGGAKQRGVVIEVDEAAAGGIVAAPIEGIQESLPPALVELALWVADYYGSTPGRALALVAPAKRERRKELPQPADRDSLPGEAEPENLTASQERALARLREALEEWRRPLPAPRGDRKREDRGLPPGRSRRARARARRHRPRSGDRARAADRRPVSRALRRPGGDSPLVADRGRAPRRARADRLGHGADRDRARSAVFAPLPRVGLICVDEEHDAAYKQESDPRYDARTVAAKRATLEGAVAIYGSATPRPESWQRARAARPRRAGRRRASACEDRRPAR